MKEQLALAVIFAMAATGVSGQEIAPRLTVDAAQAIIEGCKAEAEKNGRSHAIAVVDAGGHVIAFLRMEGNTPGVGAFSMEKAKAVALWRFSTSGMEEAVKNTPGFANAPGVVTVAGGVPIFSADSRNFLGGAAASGERPALDEACAIAGVRAAGLTNERMRE